MGERIDIETILSGNMLNGLNKQSSVASLVPKPAIEIGSKVIMVDLGNRKMNLVNGIYTEKDKATR